MCHSLVYVLTHNTRPVTLWQKLDVHVRETNGSFGFDTYITRPYMLNGPKKPAQL